MSGPRAKLHIGSVSKERWTYFVAQSSQTLWPKKEVFNIHGQCCIFPNFQVKSQHCKTHKTWTDQSYLRLTQFQTPTTQNWHFQTSPACTPCMSNFEPCTFIAARPVYSEIRIHASPACANQKKMWLKLVLQLIPQKRHFGSSVMKTIAKALDPSPHWRLFLKCVTLNCIKSEI